MKTLYERLIDICRDQGVEQPRNADIQRLCGLTSGRVTQIKNAGSAARLGDESLRSLIRLGYFADWVQEGRGPKRDLSPSSDTRLGSSRVESEVRLPVTTERERTIAEIVEVLNKMSNKGLAVMLGRADEMARQYPLKSNSKAS